MVVPTCEPTSAERCLIQSAALTPRDQSIFPVSLQVGSSFCGVCPPELRTDLGRSTLSNDVRKGDDEDDRLPLKLPILNSLSACRIDRRFEDVALGLTSSASSMNSGVRELSFDFLTPSKERRCP